MTKQFLAYCEKNYFFLLKSRKTYLDSFVGRDNFYFVFLGKVLKFVQAKTFSLLGQQLATFLSKNFAAS